MIKSIYKLIRLLYRTYVLRLKHVHANHTADYDIAAPSYDVYYSKYLGKSTIDLLKKLPVKEGDYIVDLACGTGFLTRPLAQKIGPQGKIIAVDISSHMLQCNQEQTSSQGLSSITFVHSDALQFLTGLPDYSVDGIVCAWGICYMHHKKFIHETKRVLKSGGFIGLIENKASSLKEVSNLFEKVLMNYPQALIKDVRMYLPANKDYLVKICKGSFRIQDVWEGQVVVPCANGYEIADYMVKSGAASGFLDALDKDFFSQIIQSFINYADECFKTKRKISVKHEFCAIIGTKI